MRRERQIPTRIILTVPKEDRRGTYKVTVAFPDPDRALFHQQVRMGLTGRPLTDDHITSLIAWMRQSRVIALQVTTSIGQTFEWSPDRLLSFLLDFDELEVVYQDVTHQH